MIVKFISSTFFIFSYSINNIEELIIYNFKSFSVIIVILNSLIIKFESEEDNKIVYISFKSTFELHEIPNSNVNIFPSVKSIVKLSFNNLKIFFCFILLSKEIEVKVFIGEISFINVSLKITLAYKVLYLPFIILILVSL